MASESFERTSTVQADPTKCWEVVTDVPRLVEWVSVLEDAHEVAPLASYTAVLADRLGPFKLTADLAITVSEVVPGKHIRVQATGEDHQVKSRIGIDAVLTLAPAGGGGTAVTATGSYEVIGKVATMGAGMIRQKATKILDQFFGHLTDELGGS